MRSRSPRVLVLMLVLAPSAMMGACFYGWDLTDGAQNPGADGATDGVARDGSTTDGGTDATQNDGTGGDGGGDSGGPPVQCKTGLECGPGTYCAFPDHLCGAGKIGACTFISAPPCLAGGGQFCGCDKSLYPTECAVHTAKQDIALSGCIFDAGQYFQCGYEVCMIAKQFCQDFKADGGFNCADWGVCSPLDCSCAKQSCKATVGGGSVDAGGVIVTCE